MGVRGFPRAPDQLLPTPSPQGVSLSPCSASPTCQLPFSTKPVLGPSQPDSWSRHWCSPRLTALRVHSQLTTPVFNLLGRSTASNQGLHPSRGLPTHCQLGSGPSRNPHWPLGKRQAPPMAGRALGTEYSFRGSLALALPASPGLTPCPGVGLNAAAAPPASRHAPGPCRSCCA